MITNNFGCGYAGARLRLWFCLALISCDLSGFEQTSEAISSTNRPIILFNGRDLTGFYTWLVDSKRDDPRRVFTVTNGLLRISGDGLGYLATLNKYKNYRLVAEFKWGQTNWPWGDRLGKARDAGIFLHSVGPDGNSYDGKGAFKTAIECQIMQGAVGDLILIRGTNHDGSVIAPRMLAEVVTYKSMIQKDNEGWPYWQGEGGKPEPIEGTGRMNWRGKSLNWQDVLDFRGPKDVEIPIGSSWPQIECICDGSEITILVNGQIVNRALNVFPSSGQILLQCEGSEIFFRKLELYPIRKP